MSESNKPRERRLRVRSWALIVDEDESARRQLHPMLEQHGYQVDEVKDSIEAIGLLDLEGPPLDLVVLGYDMPFLHGVETLLTLRAMQPGLKALFYVHEIPQISPENLPEKITFLEKPCTAQRLADALNQVYRTNHAGFDFQPFVARELEFHPRNR